MKEVREVVVAAIVSVIDELTACVAEETGVFTVVVEDEAGEGKRKSTSREDRGYRRRQHDSIALPEHTEGCGCGE
jgi:hypothetical protein